VRTEVEQVNEQVIVPRYRGGHRDISSIYALRPTLLSPSFVLRTCGRRTGWCQTVLLASDSAACNDYFDRLSSLRYQCCAIQAELTRSRSYGSRRPSRLIMKSKHVIWYTDMMDAWWLPGFERLRRRIRGRLSMVLVVGKQSCQHYTSMATVVLRAHDGASPSALRPRHKMNQG
jgi:hypothetical protein